MGDATTISWTDATWNPVRGCSRVSEGCRNCYAERVAARFSGPGMPYEGLADASRGGSKWTGEVRLIIDHLADPLRWKRPRRIFVNSMSDLFHERLTNEEIAAVFGVMAAAPHHTFQVLTKRAARMREWFEWIAKEPTSLITIPTSPRLVCRMHADKLLNPDNVGRPLGTESQPRSWPLPNVWLGASVENQEALAERVPHLEECPAAIRFLSCEPLLGPLDFGPTNRGGDALRYLQWVIVGCESGPGARPCKVEWLRSLRYQCGAARVAFFLKQAAHVNGGAVVNGIPVLTHAVQEGAGSRRKLASVIELPYLDGVQHAAFPEVAA